MLVLGHDIDGFSPHPENLLAMPSWTGDPEDASLERAVDFLEQLAFSRLTDIRPAIGEQQAEQKVRAMLFPKSYDAAQGEAYERARKQRLQLQSARSSNWVFRLLFGGVASTASALRSDEPAYAERKLQRLQARRKEYAHIKDLMQKQLDTEMAKEKAYYADHKMSLWDLFTRAPPANIAELSTPTAGRDGRGGDKK